MVNISLKERRSNEELRHLKDGTKLAKKLKVACTKIRQYYPEFILYANKNKIVINSEKFHKYYSYKKINS